MDESSEFCGGEADLKKIYQVAIFSSLLAIIIGCDDYGSGYFNCQSQSGTECAHYTTLCNGTNECSTGLDETSIFCSDSETIS